MKANEVVVLIVNGIPTQRLWAVDQMWRTSVRFGSALSAPVVAE